MNLLDDLPDEVDRHQADAAAPELDAERVGALGIEVVLPGGLPDAAIAARLSARASAG